MGLCKLVDAFLFIYFLFIAVVTVLFDAQGAVPSRLFPDVLVDLVASYARDFGDYLVAEKPDFFVGLIYVELIVQLPVALASLYGFLAKKSWVRTTCLIYGVSTLSTMVCLPSRFFPEILVKLSAWFVREFDHYLVAEKPDFFVGVAWVELLVQWPAAIACVYGILKKKSWVSTTCLVYGVSFLSCLIVILTEMIRSKRASEKLLTLYWPFLGMSVLAILRGLLPCSASDTTTSSGRRSAVARKKKA